LGRGGQALVIRRHGSATDESTDSLFAEPLVRLQSAESRSSSSIDFRRSSGKVSKKELRRAIGR